MYFKEFFKENSVKRLMQWKQCCTLYKIDQIESKNNKVQDSMTHFLHNPQLQFVCEEHDHR
jgi:hypothetical protein